MVVDTTRYWDRIDAGRRLGRLLEHHIGSDVVVLGLPRGGIPVAREVARHLHAPLDVILVRKLGVPGHHEWAMGAVGESDVRVLNDDVVRSAGVSDEQIHDAENREKRVNIERARLYRKGRPAPDLHGKTVIIVDDGIATGATARAACATAKLLGARHVILAVPVAPRGWEESMRGVADELISPVCPDDFVAVGQYYQQFDQVSDNEVVAILDDVARHSTDRDVQIPVGSQRLDARLTVPYGAVGCVVFAHGSGSSRHSPRNKWVAQRLNSAGFATVLCDLLTEEEGAEHLPVFDIELLGARVGGVLEWLRGVPSVEGLPVGLFGASTGAAAALTAAAAFPTDVRAVVCRGGRPDLAWETLPLVRQPVLFVVGGRDVEVLDLNRRSAERLAGKHELSLVAGAGHLFEEPHALEQVATKAVGFFEKYLR